MALSKLSGDEQRILFIQLCNVLEPRRAVYLSSVSHELREPTQALLPQLRAGHEAAAALALGCPVPGFSGNLRKNLSWRPSKKNLENLQRWGEENP
eukprot:scaffold106780_cov57-Phaeocystis_antarctica.AAC.2